MWPDPKDTTNSGKVKMKKNICFAAALAAGLTVGTSAQAQMTATFFLDARDNIAAIDTPTATSGYANEPNGGGRGDGQTIYIAPKVAGLEVQGPNNTSLATMTLYVDVDSADPNEVLASAGLDIDIEAAAANERQLLDASITVHNTAAAVGGGLTNEPWNGTAISTAFTTAGGGAKAVRVPVEDNGGPMFNAALGITDGDGYRLATVNLEADSCSTPGRGCQPALDVFLSVNNLLVTAVSNPGPSAAVALNLGYDAGAPEAATADGSTEGATSNTADAVIIIKPKGDFNNDGNFNGLDLGLVLSTFNQSTGGLANRQQIFVGDFNGDGAFNGLDLGLVLPYFNAVTANCVACVP